MRLHHLKVCISLLLIMQLTACLKPVETQTSDDSIRIWEQEDSTVAGFIDQICDDYKKLPGNENVTITRVHYGTEDLRSQYQTAAIAGTAPDLIMCPSDFGGVFAVAGFIRAVDDLFDLSKYNKAALEAAQLGGKTWGVPISNGNHLLLMYNKSLVKEVPKTTDELFKFCDNFMASRSGKTNYCMAFDMGEPFWFVPWLAGYGGWPLSEGKAYMNTPEMRKTVDFYLALKFNQKYVPPDCDYNYMDTLFKEETVPFIINGDWSIPTYAKSLGDKYAVAPLPKVSETGLYPAPMVSGKYFMINPASSEKKLARLKNFIEFYTNRDNQIKQLEELNRLPALKAANNAPALVKDPILKNSLDQVLLGKPMPMDTELRVVWDSMRTYLGRIMTKKTTPEEGLKRMQADVDNKIKEMNR